MGVCICPNTSRCIYQTCANELFLSWKKDDFQIVKLLEHWKLIIRRHSPVLMLLNMMNKKICQSFQAVSASVDFCIPTSLFHYILASVDFPLWCPSVIYSLSLSSISLYIGRYMHIDIDRIYINAFSVIQK